MWSKFNLIFLKMYMPSHLCQRKFLTCITCSISETSVCQPKEKFDAQQSPLIYSTAAKHDH